MTIKLEAELHHSESMRIIHDAIIEAVKLGYDVKTRTAYNSRQYASFFAEIEKIEEKTKL